MQPPTATPAAPARRRLGPRTAVLLVVLAVASAELALARMGYGNPRLVRTDATRGYALVGEQVVQGPHGSEERINALGFRERDWRDAPPGRPLVVVLGHSVSYGVGVDAAERWTAQLEAALRAGAAPGACVLDLAVPGYTLEQMLAVQAEVARPLAPDVVVVELGDYSIRPMTRADEPEDYPLSRWIRRSALFDFWRRKRGVLRRDQGLVARVLEDPGAPEVEGLWQAAFARLEALREELSARGARLVLLHTPRATAALEPAAAPSRWSEWCAAHPDVLELDCAPALGARMRPLAEELARRGVDPRLPRGRLARLDPDDFERREDACFFLDDLQHLTPLGHGVVGAQVAAALAPLLAE